MCLSIPARILEIDGDTAKADCGGNLVTCNLSLVEAPKVGDYVLIHAGFAIQKYDEREARETLALLREALRDETA